MGDRFRVSLVALVTLAAVPLGVTVACSSYGEQQLSDAGARGSTPPPTNGTSGDPGGDPDGSGGQTSGAPPNPMPPPPPPPSFTQACPACPNGETCVAAGCNPGERTTLSTCASGAAIDGEVTRTVFVCPDAETTNLPPTGSCDSSFNHQAAVFALGSANDWRIRLLGDSFFYHPGTCGAAGGCGSGSGTGFTGQVPPAPFNLPKGGSLAVGSNVAISGCVTIRISFHAA